MQASYTTPWLQDSAGHPPWGSPCCQLDLVFWAAAPSSTSLCRQAWGSPVCTLMRQPDSPICPVLAQQVAAAVLQQWGPSGGEERVVSHSLGALRALTNNPVAARAVVMSAAWEQLAAAVLAMVRGDAGSALAQVPPKIQGMLVALMLAPTRCVGAETAAYEEAETLSGPEVLETLQVRRCGSSGGSQRYPPTAPSQEAHAAAASGRPLPTSLPVVLRWQTYFSTFVTAVAATLSRLPPDTLSPPMTSITMKEVRKE